MALSSDSSWLETWALPSWPLRTQPRKLFGRLWILPAGFGVSALAEDPGQLRCLRLAWRLVPGARRMSRGGNGMGVGVKHRPLGDGGGSGPRGEVRLVPTPSGSGWGSHRAIRDKLTCSVL